MVRHREQNAVRLPDALRFTRPSSFRSLLNLCPLKNQDAVLKLVVATLDYSRDGLARVILSKILTAATDVRQPSFLPVPNITVEFLPSSKSTLSSLKLQRPLW